MTIIENDKHEKDDQVCPVSNSRPLPFSLPVQGTALLMIDFQGDFCNDESGSFLAAMDASAEHCQTALEPARLVLEAARRAQVPIVHTLEAHLPNLHDLTASKDRRTRRNGANSVNVIGRNDGQGPILVRASICNGLKAAVAMQDGEVALHKSGKGAFCDTELRAWLTEYYKVTHLIVCGVTTEVCVQTTMREANDRGFEQVLVQDATASVVPAFKEQTIAQITSFGAIVGHVADSQDVIQTLETIAAIKQEQKSSMTEIPPSIAALPEGHNGLPIVDVTPLLTYLSQPFTVARRGVNGACLACARQLDLACRQVGFFYVTARRVNLLPTPPLDMCQALLDQDDTYKHGLSAKAGEGPGYEPSGAQALDEGRLGQGIDGRTTTLAGDLKESFIVGKPAPSQRHDASERIDGQWPDPDTCPSNLMKFKRKLIAYHDECEAFLRTLLRGIALGLGLAADTFDCYTQDAMTKVRLLKYPAVKDGGYDQADGCGSHTDWGALSLLCQDDAGGLEVYSKETKSWLPAPNRDGSLLINVGDMLQLWTHGRYRSAPHRVVRPLDETRPRYSIAMFFNCDADAPIDPRILFPNEIIPMANNHVYTAEEYILERVAGTYKA